MNVIALMEVSAHLADITRTTQVKYSYKQRIAGSQLVVLARSCSLTSCWILIAFMDT